MEQLAVCRMCLADDVPMRLIENKYLQAMFEKVTDIPFVREDRPVMACYICCARLHNCYKFRYNCLQSEELLQRMLSTNELTPVQLKKLVSEKMFSIMEVANISFSGVDSDNTEVHVEGQTSMIDDVEVKEEIIEAVESESSEEQDFKYDIIQSSDTKVDPPNEQESIQDIPLKTLQIVLQRCDNMICEKQAPTSNTYEDCKRQRKKESTEEKPYKCNFCGKSFSRRSTLLIHNRIHTGEIPFKCNICFKSFKEKGKLVRHNRTHTGEKPFMCNFCSKRFTQKNNLLIHNRVHTGEKPFKCNVCSKPFSDKSYLVRHNRIHTGEKPFKCRFCSKSFTGRSNLLTHNRIHTDEKPFKCNICYKSFLQKGNLIGHIRVHTGEKPYKCNFCSKRFTESSGLVRHNRIHTGEKPFKCNFCSKFFIEKNKLLRHTRIHTGGKSS